MDNASNTKIHIILTGGRIDSVWNGKVDEIVLSPHSVIPDYFHNINLYGDIQFSEICMKDSRAITPDDRQQILQTIENSPANKILITHGTHTMPDTIKFINTNLKRKDQTIVFTGAVTPLKDFAFSDAGFNLGFALASVMQLPKGVYICMVGKILTPEEVERDLKSGQFYSFFPEKQ